MTMIWGKKTGEPQSETHCLNMPQDRYAKTFESEYGGWAFLAGREFGLGINSAPHPTERAAKLACEALLWRIGALPLPEWTKHGQHWECHRIFADWAFRAQVDQHGKRGRVAWVMVSGIENLLGKGEWMPLADAKRNAEAMLRAMVALKLDAEAAKDAVND